MFIQKASIGLFGLITSESLMAHAQTQFYPDEKVPDHRYPAIDEELTFSVVSASHFDFAKVKALVTKRPELAKATWDWGFGDFESALGACSHTGRRDIAEFLISYGARPDIFTFAMLGMIRSVKEITEAFPGIQSRRGPHGITLMKHVQTRLANKEISNHDKANVQKVADYIEKLGNANILADSTEMTENDKRIFLGAYKFGEAQNDIFSIESSQSMADSIRIVRKGMQGNLLLKTSENTFSPTGAPSVKIVFEVKDNTSISFTIFEPDPVVTAIKLNV